MSKIRKHPPVQQQFPHPTHRTRMKKEIYMELFSRRCKSLSDSRFSDAMNAETRNPL